MTLEAFFLIVKQLSATGYTGDIRLTFYKGGFSGYEFKQSFKTGNSESVRVVAVG